MKVIVSDRIHRYFQERNIFQARSWKGIANTPETYVKRWPLGSELIINENCHVEEFTSFAAGFEIYSLGSFCDVASAFPESSKIGRYCSIAPGCEFAGFRHPLDAVNGSAMVYRDRREFVAAYLQYVEVRDGQNPYCSVPIPQPQHAPIMIGNDVWIGDKVILRGGITIGDGAVVAGHSVVTKSIPPYTIWGGNPAKFIRLRYRQEIVDRMIEAKWWDYEMADLYRMDLARPEKFLDQLESCKHQIRKYIPRTFDVSREIADYI